MALDDAIAAMSRAPLFELLEPEALRLLAFAAQTQALRAGEPLFRRGDRAEGGYLVIRGAIALEGQGEAWIAGPGEVVDRTALFVTTTRPLDAVAREASTVLLIPHLLMGRVLEEFPEAAAALHEALAADLLDLSDDLSRVAERLRAIPSRG